ncbi:MAG: hypothetical protein V2J24_10530 [Pseudomonadales bacterium]|jgi:phenylacetate-CoA ligase|nr:hypothetical protein [Pseudomonadales bacterium]
MDIGAALARRIFDPIYERRWGLYDAALKQAVSESQYDSPDQILDQQLSQFRGLVADVLRINPLYRERFAGLDPDTLRTPEDFARLPMLQKEDLRERVDDLISEGHFRERMFHKRTGGSTGVPVHVWWDHPSHVFKRAIVRRHDSWAGMRPGDKVAALWGDTEKAYPLKERIYKALCERTIYLDTLQMDDAYLAAFVERMRAFKPRMMMGHAHSLHFLTRFLVEKGIDDLRVEGIISTAETLVPAERAEIEGYFGKVLFDRYGCEEVSLIASECEAHDGLHTSAEGLYVEVVGGDATTPGKVVVTDLINRGMPIIRYEVGDLATLADGVCACGRGLPRLGRVFGRSTDILYAPDGRKISGVSILDTFVIHIPGVKQAQIVQDRLDRVILRVVRAPGFGDASVQGIARTIADIFGERMQHDLEYVDAIEPTRRGKFQFTICEIDPPDGGGDG